MTKTFRKKKSTKKWPKFFEKKKALKSDQNVFGTFCSLPYPSWVCKIFNSEKWRNIFPKFFSHFLLLKNFILTYQLLFFCRQKWKVISRDHELWGVKFDLKTDFQTHLSFFLLGLFWRPRYQKYSPWTGEFILWHRGTDKRVKPIQKWPNNRQKLKISPNTCFRLSANVLS